MSMVKVKFLVDRTVEVPGGENEEYKANKFYEMNEASANHFIRRKQAEIANGKASAAEDDGENKTAGKSAKTAGK